VPAYGPQNDVTLKMPAFEWVHVQLHQQKGMISLSPPTICNSALTLVFLTTTFSTLKIASLHGDFYPPIEPSYKFKLLTLMVELS
ncbi:hypothetical protein KFY76_20995, partial [Salmonella enterica subsp. enterica serovar 1,4,[5],12:i:-]|nr:hypothetical protein [Salmonella enterica subsp. enterica serovar 1,4,[5],12:i:-]